MAKHDLYLLVRFLVYGFPANDEPYSSSLFSLSPISDYLSLKISMENVCCAAIDGSTLPASVHLESRRVQNH